MLAVLASGCATGPSDIRPASVVGKPCPPLKAYTAEEQTKAADELDALAKLYQPCMTCQLVEDYGALRNMCH